MSIPEILEAAAGHYGLTPAELCMPHGSEVKRRAKGLAARMLAELAGLGDLSISRCLRCDVASVRKYHLRRPEFDRSAMEKLFLASGSVLAQDDGRHCATHRNTANR